MRSYNERAAHSARPKVALQLPPWMSPLSGPKHAAQGMQLPPWMSPLSGLSPGHRTTAAPGCRSQVAPSLGLLTGLCSVSLDQVDTSLLACTLPVSLTCIEVSTRGREWRSAPLALPECVSSLTGLQVCGVWGWGACLGEGQRTPGSASAAARACGSEGWALPGVGWPHGPARRSGMPATWAFLPRRPVSSAGQQSLGVACRPHAPPFLPCRL